MKQCKVYECKRKALGLTQNDVAELAGVSSSTVANFELGKDMTVPVFRTIKCVIDDRFAALSEQEYIERKLLQYAYQLVEERPDEKLKTAGYITMFAGKLQVALCKREENES